MSDKKIPEEINRVLTDNCSDYLFCPTLSAVENLRRENIIDGVYFTGDVMADALNQAEEIAEKSDILDCLGLTSKEYMLLTLHRVSNTEIYDNLVNIVNSIVELTESGIDIVFPVHPRTQKVLNNSGLIDKLTSKVKVINPLGYFEFIKLLKNATKVLTDSGGVQKESYILKIPCITLMDDSPWPETVKDGWNYLAGNDTGKIINAALDFIPRNGYSDYFGHGACDNIIKILGQLTCIH